MKISNLLVKKENTINTNAWNSKIYKVEGYKDKLFPTPTWFAWAPKKATEYVLLSEYHLNIIYETQLNVIECSQFLLLLSKKLCFQGASSKKKWLQIYYFA